MTKKAKSNPPPPRDQAPGDQLAVRRFAKGHVLFREGEGADNAYVIATGAVTLSRLDRSGKDMPFLTLRNGEIVGEMAMIVDMRRTATATVKDETEAIVMRRDDFNFHLEKLNPFVLRILRVLVQRLKDTTDAYIES
jgi:CRP-like cAMP-binding protein